MTNGRESPDVKMLPAQAPSVCHYGPDSGSGAAAIVAVLAAAARQRANRRRFR